MITGKSTSNDDRLSILTVYWACMFFFFPYIRAGWVDCWSVPNFLLIIDYTWHPIYPQKADEQLKQSCKRTSLVSVCSTANHTTVDCGRNIILPTVHDVICVWSVRDGGIDAVSSTSSRTLLGTSQCPTALHLHICLSCPQPHAHWPLRAASRQTSRGDGNVARLSNHPLRTFAPSTDLH